MRYYLLVDFGSTLTKLTAVDINIPDIIATASHPTTIEDDINIGYQQALKKLYQKIGHEIKFDRIFACSSAAGGLRMAAIGLVEELTVEAAKRACLGAGSRVEMVVSGEITRSEINEIVEKGIDIILLAGGTDGGNKNIPIYNALALAQAGIKIPIIYAGNKACQDQIKEIFAQYNVDGYIVDNIMPKINSLNILPARQKIEEIFLGQIIEAKGISKFTEKIDNDIMPTPKSVLHAAELLSTGYFDEKGLKELVIIDIGGATTDIYSMCNPIIKHGVIFQGMDEEYAKRTVEANIGMRHSAPGVIESAPKHIVKFMEDKHSINLTQEAKWRKEHYDWIPTEYNDIFIDQLIASLCVEYAVSRHAGTIKELYSPMGVNYLQTGKDLSDVLYVIGTGGVIVNSKEPIAILNHSVSRADNLNELRPVNPEYLLDTDYILSSMGLLMIDRPEHALKIMKKRLRNLSSEISKKEEKDKWIKFYLRKKNITKTF